MPIIMSLTATAALMSAGSSLENIARLDQRIDNMVSAEGVSARPIDKRIKLARCPAPALIEYQSARYLAIRCPQLGWRIRVQLSAATGVSNTSGFVPRQNSKPVVKRGEAVELRFGGPGFSVTSSAVAMENGRIGEDIRIKSVTSKTPMVARVVKRGLVEISR